MNLNDLHPDEKGVSTKVLAQGPLQNAVSLRILAGETLKEHTTPIPATLICITGEASYEDEKENTIVLKAGDYTLIQPQVKHWVTAMENAHLLLIR